MTHHRLSITLSGVLAALACALVIGIPAARAADQDRTVTVGSGEPGYAVNIFAPSEFTVQSGATLTFTNPWHEPHTVTFNGDQALPPPNDPGAPVPTNPGEVVAYDGTSYVSSGFLLQGDSFQITLPNAGTYNFFCIIHPGMQGTVTVTDDPTAATSQETMDAEGAAAIASTLTQLKAAAASYQAAVVTKTANPDGTSSWNVTTGGLVGSSDLQQYFPASLDIQAGDTVTWTSTVPTPHTATFLGGTDFPVPPTPENPTVLMSAPAPAAGYTGVGFVNSGIIGVGWPAQSFSVQFAAAGSFPFICILHLDQGMGGVVNVTAGPSPAATGNAGLPTAAGSAPLTLQLGLLALAGVIVAAGATLARKPRR